MSTMEQLTWRTRLTHKKTIANQIVELRFEKPAGFAYQAGQFVQFLIPKDKQDILRSYSLASHPEHPELELCVKLLPGGVGSTFFEQTVTPETEIRFLGPRGRFVSDTTGEPMVFVATGAGLAPIMAIIQDELHNKKNTQSIELIFGVRFEEDIFWADRLDALQSAYPNFHYRLTVSRPNPSWAGLSGRVSAYITALSITGSFFLCGSAEMVKDVRKILVKQGVVGSSIHFEIF